jgi:hypothetical protein
MSLFGQFQLNGAIDQTENMKKDAQKTLNVFYKSKDICFGNAI